MKYVGLLLLVFVSCAAQPELTEREAMKQELRVILEHSRRDFMREHKMEIERLTDGQRDKEVY